MSKAHHLPVWQRRQTVEAAHAYSESRDPNHYHRAAQEEAIVQAWLRELPPGATVLDCPCGAGRFVQAVVELQLQYIGADISPAMLAEAKRLSPGVEAHFMEADAEHLPFPDNAVDCVILWRLLHHIHDPAQRRRMFKEAARVTRRMVLVSFHHPFSFTFLRRLAKRVVTRDWEISDITQWRLGREVAVAGLRLSETRSFKKYVSINWFACIRKVFGPGEPKPQGIASNPPPWTTAPLCRVPPQPEIDGSDGENWP
jgi:ubiquinone/menaquinone biosynthesis C-methylase UbiE